LLLYSRPCHRRSEDDGRAVKNPGRRYGSDPGVGWASGAQHVPGALGGTMVTTESILKQIEQLGLSDE
jgi:hypothetical protein